MRELYYWYNIIDNFVYIYIKSQVLKLNSMITIYCIWEILFVIDRLKIYRLQNCQKNMVCEIIRIYNINHIKL